jgi:transcriptional regulator with XRE-family HTH domain
MDEVEATERCRQLGQQLRLRRVREGYSQVRLAQVTGIGQHSISEIESGVRLDVSYRVLLRLADGLGLDLVLRERGCVS